MKNLSLQCLVSVLLSGHCRTWEDGKGEVEDVRLGTLSRAAGKKKMSVTSDGLIGEN